MHTPEIRVLLIDDDPLQSRVLGAYLANTAGPAFGLESVPCLTDGLARLAAGNVEVVLLDLGLPESSGVETFARAHSPFPGLPIVVLTGTQDEELGNLLVQAGAQDYLVKGQINGLLVRRTLRYAIERQRLLAELQTALSEIHTLSGLLPICAHCKKIRDDQGYWSQIESYIQKRSQARFSHGICPDCMLKLYPQYCEKKPS